MAQVEIMVNGQSYRIACEDGQEQRLGDLARIVDAHVGDLVEQVGQVGHTRLLVMASLLVADELVDLQEAANEISEDGADIASMRAIEAISRVSGRLEAIADRLDQA
ncbi:cell division protein ZapA [Alphaproteobacteria bacterium]|nr:cell division protein ZapA [Alphaproteobacteria bacterium]